ncbi:adenylate/guanylate cyclase domain-containing protein [Zooshikella sp. RANM57]|uniref:adenylate/guanylate cyclase domain-containing protein n=1 Tax=Zooshikella sp. RANM57 TaxID=3425863 RepID=UPI003D6EA423
MGLIDIHFQNIARKWLLAPWNTVVGQIIMFLAVFTHMANAIWALARRNVQGIAGWEWRQIVSGLLIPIMLVQHVLATNALVDRFLVEHDYHSIQLIYWYLAPEKGIWQAATLLLVWYHGCLGIHYWLRVNRWYQNQQGYWLVGAVLIPALALAGFVASGRQLLRMLDEALIAKIEAQANFTNDYFFTVEDYTQYAWLVYVGILVLPLMVRWLNYLWLQQQTVGQLCLADGQNIRLIRNTSLLDIFRQHGIPHAAICGGRGRCTTCRVLITSGEAALAPPNTIEKQALDKINAPAHTRLACQLYPTGTIAVQPLLSPDVRASASKRPGGLDGHEREVAILFLDLRDSTRLGEQRLPYDVLFILNQFFAEMTAALHDTEGHYAQFAGDGLMALYGLAEENQARVCRQALKGVALMQAKLAHLNGLLSSELLAPLSCGIGLHFGRAIVGTMGPPAAQIISAIGDDVNTAARLEQQSKVTGYPIIISSAFLSILAIDTNEWPGYTIQLKGKKQEVTFYGFYEIPEAWLLNDGY